MFNCWKKSCLTNWYGMVKYHGYLPGIYISQLVQDSFSINRSLPIGQGKRIDVLNRWKDHFKQNSKVQDRCDVSSFGVMDSNGLVHKLDGWYLSAFTSKFLLQRFSSWFCPCNFQFFISKDRKKSLHVSLCHKIKRVSGSNPKKQWEFLGDFHVWLDPPKNNRRPGCFCWIPFFQWEKLGKFNSAISSNLT